MPKVRQDAWSHEDDLLLAETVLRHIREGSTQLKAFDEVGDALNRTSAACGFRWNAEIRQKYEQAVELAKKQRKQKKREEAKQPPLFRRAEVQPSFTMETSEEPIIEKESLSYDLTASNPQPINLSEVIQFLKELQNQSSGQTKEQLKELEDQNQKLTEKNKLLNNKLEAITEDYHALLQIMDRARKMVMFDEQDYSYKPQFRMEKNGNLENLAR